MRAKPAFAVALTVAVVIDALCNAALYPPFDLGWPPNLTGFWGVFYGSFGGIATLGLLLLVTNRPRARARNLGRWMAASTFGLFGSAVLWWATWWGVSPLTLEGAWMYPLALTSLGMSLFLFFLPRLAARRRLRAERFPRR